MSDTPQTETSPAEVTENVQSVPSTPASEEAVQTTSPTDENMIPQSRFNEVIQQRNGLRDQLGTLKAEFEQFKAEKTYEDKESNLTAEEKSARDLIRATVSEELGMSLQDAKQRLAAAQEAQQSSHQVAWETICRNKGVDPNSETAQTIALGYTQRNPEATLEQTLDFVSQVVNPPKAAAPSATVETKSLVPGAIVSDKVASTTQEAIEMALKRQQSKQRTTLEILEEARQRDRAQR